MYAERVVQELCAAGDLYVDIDNSKKTLNKRIREAQIANYNYILVVGEKEEEMDQVNVRTRDNVVHGPQKLPDFINTILHEIKSFE